jgi:hypothetical protein
MIISVFLFATSLGAISRAARFERKNQSIFINRSRSKAMDDCVSVSGKLDRSHSKQEQLSRATVVENLAATCCSTGAECHDRKP